MVSQLEISRCYPGGARKAFNVTYDDGVLQDIEFVSLLNRYGLKGTFNLNAQLMEQSFSWVHENGMTVTRLSPVQAHGLYEGHEVASHTLTHPYMESLTREQLVWEIGEDKRRLEQLFGEEVAGFAVPFDHYSPQIARCVQDCGLAYGRCSEESRSYSPWQDCYRWRAGMFHLSPGLERFVESFLQIGQELALCQIVGHSYDLDAEDMWQRMEAIFQRICDCGDVLPMTHIQIVRYIEAMKQAKLEKGRITNPTETELWFRVGEETVRVPPGEDICL